MVNVSVAVGAATTASAGYLVAEQARQAQRNERREREDRQRKERERDEREKRRSTTNRHPLGGTEPPEPILPPSERPVHFAYRGGGEPLAPGQYSPLSPMTQTRMFVPQLSETPLVPLPPICR